MAATAIIWTIRRSKVGTAIMIASLAWRSRYRHGACFPSAGQAAIVSLFQWRQRNQGSSYLAPVAIRMVSHHSQTTHHLIFHPTPNDLLSRIPTASLGEPER